MGGRGVDWMGLEIMHQYYSIIIVRRGEKVREGRKREKGK